ncbi:MAG: hypothetical protein K5696_07700 [Lachnospiraceae bacterium]|nr:hypothetical protein [Lachnospiraceae bacterium]
MATRILIVSRGSGFMMDALDSNLKKSGFETVHAEPVVKSISKVKEDTDIIILLADEYVYESADALVYLKDLCEDEDLPVCLIGYGGEMDEIKQYIPQRCITWEFKRPFDAQNVTEKLKEIAKITEEKKLGKHILLVDDDATFLKMLQGWLAEKYRITAVKSDRESVMNVMRLKPQGYLLKTMSKDEIVASINEFFENNRWTNRM